MKKCFKYIIKGRVQGVGFRYFVYENARKYGICGWVKNKMNGSVEVYAFGNIDVMDYFEQELRQGPIYSSVEEVLKSSDSIELSLTGFSIKN